MTSRGNERRVIFRDDQDRRRFLAFLARVVADRHWILHAWVLMSNHYHLLVETPEMGLSRGVKWLNQRYAETFNQRHERVGHLFQGRFKGIVVEREGHLLELIRYIVLNPVRSGQLVFAGDYEWSNYRATAGLIEPPSWLEIAWTLEQFRAVDRGAAHEAYRRFVADARGASYKPWEALVGQMYLGGSEFCDRMQASVNAKARSPEHPRSQRKFVKVRLDTIAEAVAASFRITSTILKRKSQQVARKAFVQIATEVADLPPVHVARWMGVTPWAISKLYATARRLSERDLAYQARIADVRRRLS